MAEKQTEYQWYKSHGICPHCRHNEAAKGRVQCPECLEKERLRKAKCRKVDGYKEWFAEYQRNRRKQFGEEGKCCVCGEPLTNTSVKYCERCLVRARKYNKDAYVRKKEKLR